MSSSSDQSLQSLPAQALLSALPEGALICDSAGNVLGTNDSARERLRVLENESASLLDLFDEPQSVADSLRLAMLADDAVPVRLVARRPKDSIRITISMLDAMTEEGRQYFLMRLHSQHSVSRQIMSLAEKLNQTASEKEALQYERDKLRNVVDTTIPKLKVLSYEDALTGLGNRRAFDKNLEVEWTRLVHTNTPLSVVIIDVDHFKSYNDAFGHPRGDSILKIVGRTLKTAAARDCDLACRIGGEEFAYLLPNTDLRGAMRVAESARKRVYELGLSHPTDSTLSVSVGVATVKPSAGVTSREFLERADAALYRAKRLGRNRVIAAVDDESEDDAAAAGNG
jgi:diguanylate cyclase (GGDEF)-like protein